MSLLSRLPLALKAARQLGLRQVGLYARYQLGLRSGWYRWTERRPVPFAGELKPLFRLPSRESLADVLGESGRAQLLAEADAIVQGRIRLFAVWPPDGQASAVYATGHWLLNGETLKHWSLYESGSVAIPDPVFTNLPARDIKFLWEPARFGWAFTLGRAYHLTGDSKYADVFWQTFHAFNQANPPFLGPHWMSAQEVALRLMAFVWAGQVFADAACSTPERKAELVKAIAAHAQRIPSTLAYARAQNNNHLLSEAAGLYTAARALPDHPRANRWFALGKKWLIRGFENQIADDGTYVQHSVNYHRLMLQLGLWIRAMAAREHGGFLGSPLASAKLAFATRWLFALTDGREGRAVNLGANDGALFLPLSGCAPADQRPTLQAARAAFEEENAFESGPWDELSLWLDLQLPEQRIPFREAVTIAKRSPYGNYLPAPLTSVSPDGEAWTYLRIERLTSRPSHADQLHFDLWWKGVNLTPDPGTYMYNAPVPWDNALSATRFHNTISVAGRDHFERAGRFLFLGWKDMAESIGVTLIPETDPPSFLATCYLAGGIGLSRSVSWESGACVVEDIFFRPVVDKEMLTYRVQWLLPDWEWRLERTALLLRSPHGVLRVNVLVNPPEVRPSLSLARGGEMLVGQGPADPCRGWVSPTYGIKFPALSLEIEVVSPKSFTCETAFMFPGSLASKLMGRMSRHRAAAILIENDSLALIEHQHAGKQYSVLPGGGVRDGENAEQAVVREVEEVLGLRVRVLLQVAAIDFRGSHLDYFLVERTGGEFGSGTGPEYSQYDSSRGSYQPVWVPLTELADRPLKPRSLVDLILRARAEGWPAEPLAWTEEERD